MNHFNTWEEFSALVEKHIKHKSEVYDHFHTTDDMTIEYWADSARKYIDEVRYYIATKQLSSSDFSYIQNLCSIAHQCSIIWQLIKARKDFCNEECVSVAEATIPTCTTCKREIMNVYDSYVTPEELSKGLHFCSPTCRIAYDIKDVGKYAKEYEDEFKRTGKDTFGGV
jgi:hypothetical protein